DNPMGCDDAAHVAIYGSPAWNKMNERERAAFRLHLEAWRASQFLHGEQGALVCTAKIVETVPDADAKYYAATQVMDEARHVEVFSRYLREKIGVTYPISRPLNTLLEKIIRDRRWDFTYLGMQVMIEGLALAGFGGIRDTAQNALIRSIN